MVWPSISCLSTLYILKLPNNLSEIIICKVLIISFLSSTSSERVVRKNMSATLPSLKKWILHKSHVCSVARVSSLAIKVLKLITAVLPYFFFAMMYVISLLLLKIYISLLSLIIVATIMFCMCFIFTLKND